MKNQKENRSLKPNKEKANQYLRFSGLAFELFAIIGIGIWGGYKLDQVMDNQYPIFLIALTFLSTFAALYSLYRKLPKN